MEHYNIWYEIFLDLGFKNGLGLVFTCTTLKDNLVFPNFGDYDNWKIEKYLTQDIIEVDIFKNIISLPANEKINNVTFLKRLKILAARNNSGIDQTGIQSLDLIDLYIGSNNKITDVSFMKNLKKLYVWYSQSINQKSINGLDLVELDVTWCCNIFDVSYI